MRLGAEAQRLTLEDHGVHLADLVAEADAQLSWGTGAKNHATLAVHCGLEQWLWPAGRAEIK